MKHATFAAAQLHFALALLTFAETITISTSSPYLSVVVPLRAGFDPDCDASGNDLTLPPVLNSADFTCFLTRFVEGDLYADCDGSRNRPYLNVADFTCFLQSFAVGRRAPIVVQVGLPMLPDLPWYACRCNGQCISGCQDWEPCWWASPDWWQVQIAPVGGLVTFTTDFPCITIEGDRSLTAVMHGIPTN